MDFLQVAKDAANALDQKFGKDIKILNIGSISTITDYFIITEASNPNQVQAMVSGVEEALDKHKMSVRHIEGMQRSDWVLMDYGDIIVHIFNSESRAFYDLERTWNDAPQVEWAMS
jgi:ribosome-associated protein